MIEREYTSYRWTIQGALIFMQFGLGLNFMAPTPMFTLIMDEYGITKAMVSLTVSAVLMVLTISLLPSGILIARIGATRAMGFAGLLMSADLLQPFVDSYSAVIFLRLVLGTGIALSIPATSATIMEWFKPGELPIMNGVNEAGRALGLSLGVLGAVPIANNFGWQTTLCVYSAVPLIATILWIILGRKPENGSEMESPPPLRDNIRYIFNTNNLWLALGVMGPFSVFIGYSAWLPTYYNESRGMTMEMAGSIVAAMPLAAGLINPVSGFIQSGLGRRKPLLITAGLIIPVCAVGSILSTNSVMILISVMVLGVWFSMFIVAMLTIPMELPGATASRAGISTAAVLTIGNLVAVMSPIFIGSITDISGSYLPALSILAVMPLTLFIPGILLPETGPAKKFKSLT